MKRVYEKPAMMVERFEATQSVAAACSGFTYSPLEVNAGEHVCNQTSCSHNVSEGFIDTYDKDGSVDPDNGMTTVTVFTSGSCEYVFVDKKKAGLAMLGNGSWSSDEHAMVINGVQIPS